MKLYINSNGCAVLKHETERIAKYFKLNGWERTSLVGEADFVVMTCCGVTQNEEDQAIGIINSLECERKKTSSFIISGCLPAFAKEHILSVAPKAILLTYQQLDQFDQLIDAKVSFKDVYYNVNPTLDVKLMNMQPTDEEKALIAIDKWRNVNHCRKTYELCTFRKYIWQDDDVYQIKVSYGCPGNCSYCATKIAIGSFRSVNKSLVLKQFREGVELGYHRFMMVGDEVGSYGVDFGENIADLLEEIHTFAPNIEIAIRYIHPDVLVRNYERLKPFFASGFISYFCCAIQSASPTILKLMNRNPNIEPFVKCIEDMNANGYKVSKHTQIVVGFPGETEADVLATIECLMRCDFDHININKFSPRKGTKAFEMEDNVPETVKVNRCQLLRRFMMMRKKEKMYQAVIKSVLSK